MPALNIPPEQQPPGYPAGSEAQLSVADGRPVWIRPIVPDDAAALGAALDAADEDTLYRRFFTGRPRLGHQRLADLAGVDYRRRMALVAIDQDGAGVAVARYEGLRSDTEAEIAVVVDPAWRRVGLAASLLGMLAAHARQAGYRRLTAEFLADNKPAAHLLETAGYRGLSYEAGVGKVALEL